MTRRSQRLAGVDYGARRIGLAMSDTRLRLASPATILNGAGSPRRDAEAVHAWALENEATELVVGLPLNMDGTAGPQAELTRRFIAALRALGGLPVHEWDERLSTFRADELLDDLGARGRRRTARRDALAAQVILQSFLDTRATAEEKGDL